MLTGEKFVMVQLLGAPLPLKFGRAKNVQNLVRFTTTFFPILPHNGAHFLHAQRRHGAHIRIARRCSH